MKRALSDDSTVLSKVARVDGELQAFDFVDSAGSVESMALDAAALACVPYLETLVNTNVGTARGDRHQRVDLPAGCTSTACRSLVLHASAVCDPHVSSLCVSDSLEKTLTLMQTADFLCLTALVHELTLLCRFQARTPEDEQKLRALVDRHPVADPIVRSLDGNTLVKAMSTDQVKVMVRSMQPGCINASQAKVFLRWLDVSGRTIEDAAEVLRPNSLVFVWVPTAPHPTGIGGPPTRDDPATIQLFPESMELLRELAKIAAGWPQFRALFFNRLAEASEDPTADEFSFAIFIPHRLWGGEYGPFANANVKDFSVDFEVGLPRFLKIIFEPLCAVASSLSLEDLKVILPWLLRSHVCCESRCGSQVADLLTLLLDRRASLFDEVVALIPLLLPSSISTNAALRNGMVARVESMLERCSFTVVQLPKIISAIRDAFQLVQLSKAEDEHTRTSLTRTFVKLILAADPAAQTDVIDVLFRVSGWVRQANVSFMSKLCPQALMKVVAALMPHLAGSEISAEVREWISNAIANDEF